VTLDRWLQGPLARLRSQSRVRNSTGVVSLSCGVGAGLTGTTCSIPATAPPSGRDADHHASRFCRQPALAPESFPPWRTGLALVRRGLDGAAAGSLLLRRKQVRCHRVRDGRACAGDDGGLRRQQFEQQQPVWAAQRQTPTPTPTPTPRPVTANVTVTATCGALSHALTIAVTEP